ncbi:MAG TPA: branched-chain amino acid ABC transporter permease [Actinomycetota bacterium]|nr:branched-chain amino acid ABC transporter permease [Actinomycetota bacterium]
MGEVLGQAVTALTLSGVYALIAVGFTMVFGIARVTNFAHGHLYMAGAVGTWALTDRLGWPYALALSGAALAVGAASVPLLRVATGRVGRVADDAGMLGTIGMGLVLQHAAFLTFGGAPRSIDPPFDGVIRLGPVTTTPQRLLVLAISVGLVALLAVLVARTAWGRSLRAVSQDPDLARASGIEPANVRLATYFVSGALAAVAGGLIGPILSVSTAMGTPALFKAFVVVVIGGLGNVRGAIAGALAIGFAEVFGSIYVSSAYRDGYAYAILLLAIALRARRAEVGVA